MKARFYNLAAWVNSDPRRVKVISAAAVAAIFVVAHLVPGGAALAGPMPGGSDLGGH